MHEMAIAESLVELIMEEAGKSRFSKVKRVILELGAIGHVAPQALDFCFEAVTHGTLAQGARLEIVTTEAAGWCFDCEETTPLHERFGPCQRCGSRRVQMTRGDELRLKELEVE